MVLSFEIQFPLSSYAASYCIFCINQRFEKTVWDETTVNTFFSHPVNKHYSFIVSDSIRAKVPGILKIVFIHSYDKDFKKDQYFIRMKINPCELLLQFQSENLFYCTPDNIDTLQNTYAKFVYNLFTEAYIEPVPLNYDKCLESADYSINMETGEKIYLSKELEKKRTLSALPYLGLASVKRIDYSVNLRTPHNFHKFLILAKKSVLDKRKKISRSRDNDRIELENRTRTFAIYEKVKITEEEFSTNKIIRIRAIIRNPSKEWKKSNLKINTELTDRVKIYNKARGGLLPFLDEDVSKTFIKKEYDKLVGTGDFYSTYKAWKIIDESKFKKDKKQNLKELMQLISQSWSLQKAEKQYISGTSLKKNRKIVKGTQQIFRRNIKQLRELGLQPLRIPDSWHLSYLHNPIVDDISRKIMFGPEPLTKLLSKDTLKKYEGTKMLIQKWLDEKRLSNKPGPL